MRIAFAVALLFFAPISGAQPLDTINVRNSIANFFSMPAEQGAWNFKSADGRCSLHVEFYRDTGVVTVFVHNENQTLGTSFTQELRREETLPLYNDHDSVYMSFYSDFALNHEHLFILDGVFEYVGNPSQKDSTKKIYLTRSLQIQAQNTYRYVTYTETDRQVTNTISCIF